MVPIIDVMYLYFLISFLQHWLLPPPPLSVAEPCKYQSYFFFTFLLYHYIRGKVFAFFF